MPIIESFKGEKLLNVDIHTFKSTLAYIFTLIGLTRIPDKIELDIIEDYIRTTYPQFTINELRIAFKLAVQGKFECNIEHFEKFSPKYISQIMNAYKAKANEIRKNLPIKDDKPIPQLTDDEIVAFARDMWLNGNRNDFNKVYNVNRVFYILLNRGEISPSNEQIEAIIKMVREDNIQRLNSMSHLDAKEFSKKCKDPDFFDMQCKKLTLVQFFEKL